MGKYLYEDVSSNSTNGVVQVYAEVVAGLAAVTSLVYALPFFKSYKIFPWDVMIFILWTALFGVFGNLYIGEDPEGDKDVARMKHAVWVDLVNMLLWFVSSVVGASLWWRNRTHRSLHTGRATV